MQPKKNVIVSPGVIHTALSTVFLWLWLQLQEMSRHFVVAGTTGGGKTMLLISKMRQLIDQGIGFTVITPHPGIREALLHYCAANQVPASRVVDINLGDPDCAVSFDPYVGRPNRRSLIHDESWLSATADRILRALLRNVSSTDQEMMRRLKRWAENVLVVCGVEVDGEHLGLDSAWFVLSPGTDEFAAIMEKVGPELRRLRPDVYDDFQKLIETRNARQQEQWVESSINLLRDLLRPMARQTFGQMAPSLSMRDMILGSKIVIVDVSESEYLSREQGKQFGGLWYQFLTAEARRLGKERKEEDRVWHAVFIDEFQNFVAEDTGDSLGEMRKFRLIHGFAFQDLSCLEKGDQVTLVGKVCSNVANFMTFAQNNPDDIEYLAKFFKYGDLDLTPLEVQHTVFHGYKKVITQGMSVSFGKSHTHSESESKTLTHSTTKQKHFAESIQQSVSEALSESHTEGASVGHVKNKSKTKAIGSSESQGGGWSKQSADGKAETRTLSNGKSEPVFEGNATVSQNTGLAVVKNESASNGISASFQVSNTESNSKTSGDAWSKSKQVSDSTGKATTNSLGNGKTKGESQGESHGESVGNTVGDAHGQSKQISFSINEGYLADQTSELVRNGKTVVAVADQFFAIGKTIASLRDRMLLCKIRGMNAPFLLETHEVGDPYEEVGLIRSPEWKEEKLADYLAKIHAIHPFYFAPDEDRRRERVHAFLFTDVQPDVVVDPDADEDDPPAAVEPVDPDNPSFDL